MEFKEEKPQKRAQKTFSVTLKKAVFIDGAKIGNEGAVLQVDADTRKQLKSSGVIDENA